MNQQLTAMYTANIIVHAYHMAFAIEVKFGTISKLARAIRYFKSIGHVIQNVDIIPENYGPDCTDDWAPSGA